LKLIALLEELEQHIENSRRIPLTSKLVVEGDQLLDYLDQIREALPNEIEEARRIFQEQEKMMKAAKRDAEQLVEETRVHITRMVDNHEVNRLAQEQAEKIIAEARQLAKEIREGANEYADEILKNIESIFEQVAASTERNMSTVKRGREELNRNRRSSDD